MSKKGIVFSLIAIGLAGLFILLFSTPPTERLASQEEVVRTRITNLDEHIGGFYTYAEQAQRAAGRAALHALYDSIKQTGVFLPDFEDNLTRCLNDSDGCDNDDPLEEFLDNYTAAVEAVTDTTLSYHVTETEVVKESYWSITVRSEIAISLHDTYAAWEYAQNVTSRIPTTGTYDPLFLKLSDMYSAPQPVERLIEQAPFYTKTSTPSFRTAMEFYTIGQYQYSEEGSCLSQRYEGDVSAPAAGSRCGIETIINPDDFPDLSSNPDITHLDWQASRGITYPCDERYYIDDLNPELRLSEDDANRYGLYPPYSTPC